MTISHLVPWKKRHQDNALDRQNDNPFFSLSREMNRLFDDFRNHFDIEPFGFTRHDMDSFMPTMDVTENEKDVQITCELPGLDEKDIDITLSNDAITIKGEKKQENEDKGKDYYRMERSYGSFVRTVPLPVQVDDGKADAQFKKGVLKVTLPKSADAQKSTKKIEVKSC